MDRHGLQPRDDEKAPVIASPTSVIASEARQSTSPTPEAMDRHGLRPRDDEKAAVIASPVSVIASKARQSIPASTSHIIIK
jgi:hypothetical protein